MPQLYKPEEQKGIIINKDGLLYLEIEDYVLETYLQKPLMYQKKLWLHIVLTLILKEKMPMKIS